VKPESWIRTMEEGICVAPGGFHVDPVRPVDRAIVTHGHSDHARGGNRHVLATPETIEIMRRRLPPDDATQYQPLRYGETIRLGDIVVRLVPAGHILGSAQVVMEHAAARVVVSGDYKRRPDPTCPPFEPVKCDVFVTEATFALPVFRHPDDAHEIGKLLRSLRVFPERAHVVGVYALGKCQRVLKLLRQNGYDEPVYVHGALEQMNRLYEAFGVALGKLLPATGPSKKELEGRIVLAPPGATTDRWARRLPDPIVAMASGWMRVRQRARSRGVELPLVISDHADWDELCRTIDDVEPDEVWVTHGREEALIRAAELKGVKARALHLVGYEEEAGA
jgi:putative mRNA 3-end processing factor